ncbi:MAG: saccharopine dehydrogenase family protein [Candidatus Woesearchaeota archaeon]
MKILLIGGGAQGRAALFDLLRFSDCSVVVADNNLESITSFIDSQNLDRSRIILVEVDANNKESLLPLFRDVDIVLDLLPTIFRKFMTELAIETKTNIVNTSFHSHVAHLANDAALAGITVMPEAGLDPGIDLILAGHGISCFDEVYEFSSACGGIPNKDACTNPLNYKISWNFEGVLSAYKRPGDIIIDGEVVSVSSDNVFDFSREIDVEGVGLMDIYPNGHTSTYASLLNLSSTIKNMGRYTLRWSGHSEFWRKIVALGLIDDEPVLGISPRQYLAKVLEPKLQYESGESDLVVLRNEFKGVINGESKTLVQTLVDERDLETGLMAMNRTVGFTASIVTLMILNNIISETGLLSPARDVPFDLFLVEIEKRNIKIKQKFV